MSTGDLVRRMAAWPGSSQPGRNDPRLAPEAAPLEDRDTAAFLAAARSLAAHVQRYGLDPETPEGDWRSFFPMPAPTSPRWCAKPTVACRRIWRC